MAKTKKKKGKVTPGKISFSDTIHSFKAGDFKKASALLKKARVLPEEVGLEKQLKSEINNHFAYELFLEFRFKEAIALVENNFKMEPRKGFPLSLEKSRILTGLSHLYLGNFELAAAELAKAPVDMDSQRFHFYEILAGLYAEKYKETENVEAFQSLHQEYFEQADPVRKQYLQAIFYLLKSDEKNFNRIIGEIKPESHFQHQNFSALLSIIGAGEPDLLNNSKVKPLYKLFKGAELSFSERMYFSNFEFLEHFLSSKERREKKSNLNNNIRKLCQEGKPLNPPDLETAMADASLSGHHSFIVYNQIASLFNEHWSSHQSYADKLIKKYREEFFKVPESIFLYFNILNTKKDESTDFFFDIIDYYLKIQAETLSLGQLNAMGWYIYNSFFRHPGISRSKTSEEKISTLSV